MGNPVCVRRAQHDTPMGNPVCVRRAQHDGPMGNSVCVRRTPNEQFSEVRTYSASDMVTGSEPLFPDHVSCVCSAPPGGTPPGSFGFRIQSEQRLAL